MSVQIDVSDLDRLVSESTGAAQRDIAEAYMTIASSIVGDIRSRFDSDEFAPLAASTQIRRGPGAKPLRDTMNLYDSVTALFPGVENSDFSVGEDGLCIGTTSPGAEEAQYGSIHEPQRQFLPEDDDYIYRVAEETGAINRLLEKIAGKI